MRAIRTGKIDTVRIFLAAKPDLATKNTLGMTPFLIACAYGDVDKIKLLMDAGCDKAAKDTRGWGAIDHARNRVDARREEVVKYLEPLVPASTAAAPPQVPGAAK
jgi:ankyrin repeat protein